MEPVKKIYSFSEINEALLAYVPIFQQEELKKKEEREAPKKSVSGLSNDDLSKLSSNEGPPTAEPEIQEKSKIEVGYFHLLNCDIKASEDLIRSKFMERAIELQDNYEEVKREKMGNHDSNTSANG